MADTDLFTPRMPEVDIRPEIGAIFSRARAAAAQTHTGEDGIEHRQVIIITPGRLLVAKCSPLAEDIPVEQLALLNELVPPKPRINIAVLAYTYLDALKKDIRRAIPFFDFLLGFAALGHTVWVFEGHTSALVAGCREVDLLLVDSGLLPALEAHNPDWRAGALQAMRGDIIKLIARPVA
jgi:hypothetical protein